MYKVDNFYKLDYVQLAGVFSCFTNISIQDDLKDITIKSKNKDLNHVIETIHEEYDEYNFFEKKYMLDTGECYDLHYDLVPYIMKWCQAENEPQCKLIIKELYHEKGIFLGEFIKAVLKINNIVSEMEDIAEVINDLTLMQKCKQIQESTLKYIVVNQSLYI